MAAAEYYQMSGAPQPAPLQAPQYSQQQGPPPNRYRPSPQQQPQPQVQGQQQPQAVNPPYPIFDGPPPPYSTVSDGPRPQSQPPPQRYGRPQTGSGAPTPPTVNNPYQGAGYQYPPEKWAQQNQNQPQNGYYPSGAPSVQNPPQNGRASTPSRPQPPGASPYRQDSYNRSRSRSRSRSRDRRDRPHRHHHSSKPRAQRKKSSGVDTFLGAGGGAIIGDAIFPGLGTLGGALLGGLGGHEYGKKRARSHDPRIRTERKVSNGDDYGYSDEHRRGRK
ncbi:hypothetical protein K431DRAFT_280217 [Polychaeton citri CBS 116435]|uniref:Glycine zipper 2TM domain-containing protein n=1 Tax=Polychaeton citri CBS 116435 TaxID=1314669 RepID=A0A9P4QI54_9PEZI|nr:hypothetical protein K431DRAFT_280217 [Polychaeton citri CBS 116435]